MRRSTAWLEINCSVNQSSQQAQRQEEVGWHGLVPAGMQCEHIPISICFFHPQRKCSYNVSTTYLQLVARHIMLTVDTQDLLAH